MIKPNKKGRGSGREQLRAMQRNNRRTSARKSLSGKTTRPRDERIKRNHMQMASVGRRERYAIAIRAHDPRWPEAFELVPSHLIP